MHELLSNPLVAGLLGAIVFLAGLFGFAAVWNVLDRRLASPCVLRDASVSDDELICALTDTVSRSRRRLFRPHVEGSDEQRPRPPATLAELLAAEHRMGFALPPLLRRVYLEVANGGFGPPYGLLGVGDAACDRAGDDISREYVGRRSGDPEDPSWLWPEHIVPLISLGCASYLCADTGSPDTPILEFDADVFHGGQPMASAFKPFYPSLRAFLQDWASGKAVIDPNGLAGVVPNPGVQWTRYARH